MSGWFREPWICVVCVVLALSIPVTGLPLSMAIAADEPAQSVRIRAGVHDDFTRIVFDWPSQVDYEARLDDNVLTVEFSREATFDAAPAQRILGPAIGAPRTFDDGRRVEIPLKGSFELKHFRIGERVVIDLVVVSQASEETATSDAVGEPEDPNAGKTPSNEVSAAASASAKQAAEVPDASKPDASKPDASKKVTPEAPTVLVPRDIAVPNRRQDNASVKPPVALLPSVATPDRASQGHPVSRLPPHPAAPAAQKAALSLTKPAASGPTGRRALGPVLRPKVQAPGEGAWPATDPVAPTAESASVASGAVASGAGASGVGQVQITQLDAEAPPQVLPLGHSPERFDPVQLRFTWRSRPAAAAFRYGGEIWLVFDESLEARTAARIASADVGFSAARQLDSDNGSALLISAVPGLAVRLTEQDDGWLADIRLRSPLPEQNLEAELLEAPATGKLIRFASEHSGRIHWFSDPNTLERLVVVPLGEVGRGLSMGARHPQFEVVQSQQGLALRPLNEGLEIAVTENGVLLRHRDGLLMSSKETRELMPLDRSANESGPRLFNLVKWRRGGSQSFVENEQRLVQTVIASEGVDLPAAHLDLARFYFAWGLATETLGLLNVLETEAPRMAEDPEIKLMRAVSAFQIEDYRTAGALLADPALSGEREALLWRAAQAARTQDWQVAASGFALAEPLIFTYPDHVRNDLLLWGTEARLGVGDTGGASEYLVALTRRDLSKSEEARAKYLTARRFYLDGDEDLAVKLWRELASDNHQATQARARLGLLDIGLQRGEISDEEAIAELERLGLSWCGGHFERAL